MGINTATELKRGTAHNNTAQPDYRNRNHLGTRYVLSLHSRKWVHPKDAHRAAELKLGTALDKHSASDAAIRKWAQPKDAHHGHNTQTWNCNKWICNIPASSGKTNWISQKNTKTRMTAVTISIDVRGRWTPFSWMNQLRSKDWVNKSVLSFPLIELSGL